MAETQTIEGRSLKPLSKKLNPIWWFLNDDEEQTAPWYQPKWPQWRRDFYWNFLRNPLQNFRCYVIGVADRNYTVAGRAPVMTVRRDDLAPPENGWQWCVIKLGALRLPFVSYAEPSDGGIRGGRYFALCQGPPPRRGRSGRGRVRPSRISTASIGR